MPFYLTPGKARHRPAPTRDPRDPSGSAGDREQGAGPPLRRPLIGRRGPAPEHRDADRSGRGLGAAPPASLPVRPGPAAAPEAARCSASPSPCGAGRSGPAPTPRSLRRLPGPPFSAHVTRRRAGVKQLYRQQPGRAATRPGGGAAAHFRVLPGPALSPTHGAPAPPLGRQSPRQTRKARSSSASGKRGLDGLAGARLGRGWARGHPR